jgi:hypothetical protein
LDPASMAGLPGSGGMVSVGPLWVRIEPLDR